MLCATLIPKKKQASLFQAFDFDLGDLFNFQQDRGGGRKMFKLPRYSLIGLLFVGFASIAMLGCGGSQAVKTGFLKDYSQLRPHPEIEGRYRYINRNIDISKYNKFIVDPVAINLSQEGKDQDIDPEELDKLAKHFRWQIGEQLNKDYSIVRSPGPDVIRIRTSISEVKKGHPLLNIHPATKLTGAGLGGAGAEMELTDSVSGELIAAGIDNQQGSRLALKAGFTQFGHAESVMDKWAEDLKKMVDKVHGKTIK